MRKGKKVILISCIMAGALLTGCGSVKDEATTVSNDRLATVDEGQNDNASNSEKTDTNDSLASTTTETADKENQESADKDTSTEATTGENNTDNNENTNSENSGNASNASQNSETAEKQDGLPPVDDELREFYKNAEKMCLDIIYFRLMCDSDDSFMVPVDNEGNRVDYWRVTEPGYGSMSELKAKMNLYFTEEFTDKLISDAFWGNPRFKESDGKLYMVQAARGGNIMFAGRVFEPVVANDTMIKIPVKDYIAKNAVPYDIFYETPEDIDAYDVESYTQVMVKVNGEWRFSEFR